MLLRWFVELFSRIVGRPRNANFNFGTGWCRENYHLIQATSWRSSYHNTDNRFQCRASTIQKFEVSSVGFRWTDQYQVCCFKRIQFSHSYKYRIEIFLNMYQGFWFNIVYFQALLALLLQQYRCHYLCSRFSRQRTDRHF